MRHCLVAALLSLILGSGGLVAGDLTTAQAQQLISAAQGAVPGGKPAEATLSIDGKPVVFNVTRDAVGNVIARPVPGPDSAGIAISQVSIQMRVDASGHLQPTSLVVVSSSQTIASYSVQLNPDGTIANLYQAGTFSGGAVGSSPAQPVVGGIGGGQEAGDPALVRVQSLSAPSDRFPAFTAGQLPLPAGAGTAEVSQSRP
jgi:hypothetical protein